MDEKLKPCPFCGSEAYIKPCEVNPRQVFICCTGCCSCSDLDDNTEAGRQSIIECWNNRPVKEKLEARIAKLEAAMQEILKINVIVQRHVRLENDYFLPSRQVREIAQNALEAPCSSDQ